MMVLPLLLLLVLPKLINSADPETQKVQSIYTVAYINVSFKLTTTVKDSNLSAESSKCCVLK